MYPNPTARRPPSLASMLGGARRVLAFCPRCRGAGNFKEMAFAPAPCRTCFGQHVAAGGTSGTTCRCVQRSDSGRRSSRHGSEHGSGSRRRSWRGRGATPPVGRLARAQRRLADGVAIQAVDGRGQLGQRGGLVDQRRRRRMRRHGRTQHGDHVRAGPGNRGRRRQGRVRGERQVLPGSVKAGELDVGKQHGIGEEGFGRHGGGSACFAHQAVGIRLGSAIQQNRDRTVHTSTNASGMGTLGC